MYFDTIWTQPFLGEAVGSGLMVFDGVCAHGKMCIWMYAANISRPEFFYDKNIVNLKEYLSVHENYVGTYRICVNHFLHARLHPL